MSINKTFIFIFGLILVLFMLTGYSVYELNVSIKTEYESNKRRQEIRQLGQDLASGSDYLTNQIRSYVQFGDRSHFDNFWTEVKVTKSRDRAVFRLKELGVSQKDFNILQKAKDYSDNLIKTEDEAMAAVAKGDFKTARELVFGSYYKEQKNLIMGNIARFQASINSKTKNENDAARNRASYFRSISNISLGLSGILVIVSFYFMVLILQKLQLNEEKLLKNNIFSELHKNIAVSANQNLPVEEGMKLVVNYVCEGLGWPVGHVYLPDPENPSEQLISSKIWYVKDPEIYNSFIEVTDKHNFGKGVGLPGRVLASGKPEGIKTVTLDPNFPRAPIAEKVGLKAGLAFPILIGTEVIGVMEFFSDIDKQPDKDLLIMMGDIGILLGSLVERKRGEEQLIFSQQQAEKANQAKSIFISSMSHEIRTPMNAILGYSQILERDKGLSSKQKKGVESIHRAGKHLLNIINDILDFSKIEAGKMEMHPHNFDLGSLAQDLLVIFSGKCKERKLELKSEGVQEGQKINVYGEASKIRQILVNILGNAVKFTESGSVTLRVMPVSGDQFYFEVKDTGEGIPEEKLKTIFESFQQDEEGIKKGGTGLGLAIAKKFVSIMGGELEVESEIGRGSRFFFTIDLPPAQEDIKDKDDHLIHAMGLAKGHSVKTVLIDDNLDNLNVLSETLQDIGVETVEAESGLDGLERIRELQPDIIFVDYHMPGMDGLEVTKRVKEEYGDDKIKIVMISASTFDHHRELYMKEGVHGFIGKPFIREEILGAMARLLSVEYEYEEATSIKAPSIEEIDFSAIQLPAELHASMKEMVNMGMMSELEESLAQVESSGPDGPGLAAHIKELIDQFDTDGIIKALEAIEKN